MNPSSHFSNQRLHYSKATMMVVLGIVAALNSGCQSLHPFAQKTQKRLGAARQWASGGLDAFHNGRLDQAKGFFSRAAEENPKDASVRENYAKTLFQSGDSSEAISQLQRAVDLSHNDPRLLVQLGEMYLEVGQWLPARRQVELALNQNHRYAPAWVLSGKTEKAKANYEKALADFQRALGYAPNLPVAEMEIVDTYQKMNQPMRALSAVEQILSKHPSDDQPEPAVIAKSVALMNMEQLQPAIDILQVASQKENASSNVFVRLGQAQLLAGQVSEARLTLNRGQQVFPNLDGFSELAAELRTAETTVAATGDLLIR